MTNCKIFILGFIGLVILIFALIAEAKINSNQEIMDNLKYKLIVDNQVKAIEGAEKLKYLQSITGRTDYIQAKRISFRWKLIKYITFISQVFIFLFLGILLSQNAEST